MAHLRLMTDYRGIAVPPGDGKAQEKFQSDETARPLQRMSERVGDREPIALLGHVRGLDRE